MIEPHACDRCSVIYDEARGDGYCGLCPSCADDDSADHDAGEAQTPGNWTNEQLWAHNAQMGDSQS
jgi:rubredoxin